MEEPRQGIRSDACEPAVGERHHLYRPDGRMLLPASHHGCLLTQDRRLVPGRVARVRLHPQGAPHGHRAGGRRRPLRAHPPLRPRRAVLLRHVRGGTAEARHTDIDDGGLQAHRQRRRRARERDRQV